MFAKSDYATYSEVVGFDPNDVGQSENIMP